MTEIASLSGWFGHGWWILASIAFTPFVVGFLYFMFRGFFRG